LLRSSEFAVFVEQNRQIVVCLGIFGARSNSGAIMLFGLGPIIAFEQHRVVVMCFSLVRAQSECSGVATLCTRHIPVLFEKDTVVVVRLSETRAKADGRIVVLFGSNSVTGDIEEARIPQPCIHIVGTQFDRLTVTAEHVPLFEFGKPEPVLWCLVRVWVGRTRRPSGRRRAGAVGPARSGRTCGIVH